MDELCMIGAVLGSLALLIAVIAALRSDIQIKRRLNGGRVQFVHIKLGDTWVKFVREGHGQTPNDR